MFEALLVGLWAMLCGIDKYDVALNIHRPLITGPIIGLILGDLQTGLIAGATMELAWLGLIPHVGVQPPDVNIGAIAGTTFAIKLGISPDASVGMAIPFAMAMQALIIFLFTSFAPVMQKCDEYAEKGDTKGIDNMLYLGLSIRSLLYGVVAFASVYYGTVGADFIIQYLPVDVIDGMGVAGRMMPAVGFAMLLRIMFNIKLLPYFILGFLLTTYLQIPIIAVAITFLCFAVLDYYHQQQKETVVALPSETNTPFNMDSDIDASVQTIDDIDTEAKKKPTRLDDDIDAYHDNEVRKVITTRDLWKIGLRGLFMEGNYNYERMQAGGFCFSMIPALKKIHRNPRDLAKSLKNNMVFYNASPKLFTLPLGLTIAMEENKEKPSTINSVKAATMGPTGGIGDAIDHTTMMPLTLGVGAAISLQGNIAGPFVFFLLYQSYHFFVYFWLLFFGYKSGVAALDKLSEQAQKLGRSANILGLGVVGAMSASFIQISTPLVLHAGEAELSVQTDLLDKIMPNILPFTFVWLMFYLIQKGMSANKLIFATLIAGISGRLIGLF